MRLRARHYATGQLLDVVTGAGQIIALESPALGPDPLTVADSLRESGSDSRSESATFTEPDLSAGWVAPALFDLQINGCDGHSFNSERLTPDGVRHVVAVCRRHGLGGLCPTLVTNSFEALAHGLATLRRACDLDADLARSVPAIHLEGPYISPEDGPRGAHPKRHVRAPDWDEFRRLQDAAGGRVRLLTLAPEHDGALPFIERLTAAGVVVALGHTAASGERIRDAVRAGARLSTHLGNGSHAVLPRHPNYVWEQLANDGLWASLICDGHHLPPSVVRCMVRVKTPVRTILTCDASSLAGLPPGRYREWDQDFEVHPAGKVIVPGTSYLAGSWAFTDLCVGNVIRFAGVSLAEAVDMAGAAAQLLGLPPRCLEPGQPAELVLFDWRDGGDFRPRTTILGDDIFTAPI